MKDYIRRAPEVALDEQLSGNAYVRLGLPGEEPGRVRVRQPANCDHGITICTECVESWEIDHDIQFHRTAAGRRLAKELAR